MCQMYIYILMDNCAAILTGMTCARACSDELLTQS